MANGWKKGHLADSVLSAANGGVGTKIAIGLKQGELSMASGTVLMRLYWSEAPFYLIICICMILFIYGSIRFPDGPIAPCADHILNFCGRWGKLHSLQDYRSFTIWRKILLFSWPFGMVSVVLLSRMRIYRFHKAS
jgi:hypothetical protein